MNLKNISPLVTSAAFVLISASTALAQITVTEDFDDQPGGVPAVATTGDFNPHVTFSTEAGATLLIFEGSGPFGASPPNNLSAAVDTVFGPFNADLYVDFTNPVQNLSFNILADNDAGTIAQVKVFVNGLLTNTLDVVGNSDIFSPIPFDLTSFADVTRLEVVGITDEFGLAYDDFVFDIPVPEPTAASLFAAGLIGLGLAIRRSS